MRVAGEPDACIRESPGLSSYFSRETFRFLADLEKHNEREWFAANKARYEEHLKEPALRLIEDFAPRLHEMSQHFRATPRSLFRIHRDTRFARDKSPYKTYAGIHFRHDSARDAHAPGFYFHIQPGTVFAGVGIWHPDPQALRTIREHIVEEPDAWKRASRGKRFTGTFSLEGERLARAPKGFDPEHPLVEDLKWKDYVGVADLGESAATGRDLVGKLSKTFSAGTPFMRFLCGAFGVPF